MTTSSEGAGGEPSLRPVATRSPGIGRSYVWTVAGSVGMLACNLYTGVVSARLLDPDGRGVLGAIAAWAVTIGFLSGFGFRDGMTWLESLDPRLSPTVLTTTAVAVFVCAGIGIAFAELLVPVGFSAQTASVVVQARIFMIWILPWVAYNSMGSLFQARQRFLAVTTMRVGQPLLYAIGLSILWAVGSAGVTELLTVQVLSVTLTALVAFASLARESGMGPFDRDLARRGAHYGIRAYGSAVGGETNARLDQLVLPAVVGATQIGYYVVAVSAATMIVGLVGSLNLVVFPAAARAGGEEAVAITQRAIRIVFVAAGSLALVLMIIGEEVVVRLYGEAFRDSATPLRLLLPGVCFWAASGIVLSGLKALGRPGLSSLAQFAGVAVTVVGLLALLRPLGVEGAALVSSLSYATVFVVGLLHFNRAAGATVASTLNPKLFVGDIGAVMGALRRRQGAG